MATTERTLHEWRLPGAMMWNLESALQLARRHVADASRLVDRQSTFVARGDHRGDQLKVASELLDTMHATLAILVEDLARLEAASKSRSLPP